MNHYHLCAQVGFRRFGKVAINTNGSKSTMFLECAAVTGIKANYKSVSYSPDY